MSSNTFPSLPVIDPETLEFEINVDGLVSSGGLGGPAILPLSLAKMAQITQAFPDRSFSGIGGVSDFSQALSYLLLGCGTVQVCTAAMLDQAIGPNVIRKLRAGLDAFLEAKAAQGWTRLEDFRGHPARPHRLPVEIRPARYRRLPFGLRSRRLRSGGHDLMRLDRIIKGGNVVTPGGSFIGDVGICDEKIVALGVGLDPAPGTRVIDATGHHVIPGVLDVHVHLELPFCGTVSADDYRTGTRAGARGGVTTVIDFAIPYAGESLEQAADNWMQKAEGKALIDYTFHICITRWNEHKIADQGNGGSRVHHLQGVHDLRVRGLAVRRPRALRHAGEDAGTRHDAARARGVGPRAR